MATVPSKHSRDLPQDWELSLKDKDKKLRLDVVGKGKLDRPGQPSRSNISDSARVNTKQYDYLKEYEALSQLSSGASSQENLVDANSEKELGNEFFKQKKFNEAIDCYSRSIALSPTAVAYANRAMSYIKIRRFKEAENDCTEALNLDDRYIKAYSRRSTARKELGKLKESVDDAEFALRLEPQNQEVKKQYAECKSLLNKDLLKKASGVLTRSVEGERVVKSEVNKNNRVTEILENRPKGNNNLAEVVADTSMEIKRNSVKSNGSDSGSETTKSIPKSSKQELKASVQELAAKAANLAKAEAAKTLFDQIQLINLRRLGEDYLVTVTSPAALPGIFKNALSAPILVDIIRCIATFSYMALGVDYLQNLIKIPRFDTLIMCLASADKDDIAKIWNEVFSKGSTEYAAILSNLRPRYCMKQQ